VRDEKLSYQFENIKKQNIQGLRFPSEAIEEIVVPNLEENRKKPAGCFHIQ